MVTGSTRGLGYAMARELGRQGAVVVLAARSAPEVAAAVERLQAEGIAASGRRCDTGEFTDVEGRGFVGGSQQPQSAPAVTRLLPTIDPRLPASFD